MSPPGDSISGVELTRERRRPLSRETRLLLMTILVSFAALWVLARIRFAERPVTPNPITPVLTQLAPPPVFEQLSSAVFQVESRLSPVLMGIEVRRSLCAVVMGLTPFPLSDWRPMWPLRCSISPRTRSALTWAGQGQGSSPRIKLCTRGSFEASVGVDLGDCLPTGRGPHPKAT